MNHKLKDAATDALFEAIMKLETLDEYYNFFEDLCTIAELKAMSQRWEVAMLLNEGLPYHEIVEKTGASTATISRVNKCLQYGSDGYRKVLK